MELTRTLDLGLPSYNPPARVSIAYRDLSPPPDLRTAVVNALVRVHSSLYQTNQRLSHRQGRYVVWLPVVRKRFLLAANRSDALFSINHRVRLYNEKRDELEEQQRRLRAGLDKLKDAMAQVEEPCYQTPPIGGQGCGDEREA
jgi:dynein heavy chain 1, cytosolic